MTFYRTTRLMLSGATFLSLAGSAFALDGQDLLKKLNAAYSVQSGTIAADGVDVNDTTVTLKNARVKPNGGEAFTIGDITLTGVEEDEDGGYYIEEAAFPDINTTQDGATITASELTIGGISIPADASGDGLELDAALRNRSRWPGQGGQGRQASLLPRRERDERDASRG